MEDNLIMIIFPTQRENENIIIIIIKLHNWINVFLHWLISQLRSNHSGTVFFSF